MANFEKTQEPSLGDQPAAGEASSAAPDPQQKLNELEAKHADFLGKTILYTTNRYSGVRFFESLAETQLILQPNTA